MAMTKDDYEALGRSNCRLAKEGNGLPDPYPRGGKSWQARAYWLGWDHESTPNTEVPKKPSARQEHIRQLKQEINTSKIMTANRLLRISAKIQHLQSREALCAST